MLPDFIRQVVCESDVHRCKVHRKQRERQMSGRKHGRLLCTTIGHKHYGRHEKLFTRAGIDI